MRAQLLSVAVLSMGLASIAGAAVTADSTTWGGSYEANVLPENDGWTLGASGGSSSVSGGVLSANTIGDAGGRFWSINTDPAFNFTIGATIEFKTSYSRSDGWGSYGFVLSDGVSSVSLLLSDAVIWLNSGTLVGTGDTDALSHVYRLTVQAGTDNVKLYVDNDLAPVLQATLGGDPAAMLFYFGDLAGSEGSAYELDYIRWTNEGALAPAVPEPAAASFVAFSAMLLVGRRRRDA